MQSAFYSCKNLHTIPLLEVNRNVAFTSTFGACSALTEIRFAGEIGKDISLLSSTKLTKDSICSTIEHLASPETEITGKTLTLSIKAVNKAFETSEGANDGSTSAEWIELAGEKDNEEKPGIRPNWTITLS